MGEIIKTLPLQSALGDFSKCLGQWQDVSGCWFEHVIDQNAACFWIADRGRGIRATLRSVLPPDADDKIALVTAFEKKVSGRAPEKRDARCMEIKS